MTYQLIIGKQETSWREEDKAPRYMGNNDHARLDIPTVEAAHKIAELVGAKSYIIADSNDTFGHKPVFTTPDIIKWNEDSRKAREQQEDNDAAKAVRMNALPTTYDYKRYGDVMVVFQRSTAEYRPSYSHQIQWSLNMARQVDGQEIKDSYDYNVRFYPEEFRTKAGSWLKAKFFKTFDCYIERHPDFAKAWDDLPDMVTQRDAIRRQINNA